MPAGDRDFRDFGSTIIYCCSSISTSAVRAGAYLTAPPVGQQHHVRALKAHAVRAALDRTAPITIAKEGVVRVVSTSSSLILPAEVPLAEILPEILPAEMPFAADASSFAADTSS